MTLLGIPPGLTKSSLSHMIVYTKGQHIHCIIILMLTHISFNRTQLEINKMLIFLFKRNICYDAFDYFLDLVTDPSCTSVNKT